MKKTLGSLFFLIIGQLKPMDAESCYSKFKLVCYKANIHLETSEKQTNQVPGEFNLLAEDTRDILDVEYFRNRLPEIKKIINKLLKYEMCHRLQWYKLETCNIKNIYFRQKTLHKYTIRFTSSIVDKERLTQVAKIKYFTDKNRAKLDKLIVTNDHSLTSILQRCHCNDCITYFDSVESNEKTSNKH